MVTKTKKSVRNSVDGHPLIDIDYRDGKFTLCRNCDEDQFNHGASPSDTKCDGVRVYCKEASVAAKRKKKTVRKTVRAGVVGYARASSPSEQKFDLSPHKRRESQKLVASFICTTPGATPTKAGARRCIVVAAGFAVATGVSREEFLDACEHEFTAIAWPNWDRPKPKRRAVAKPKRA